MTDSAAPPPDPGIVHMLAHLPADTRAGVSTLFALDARLATIVATTTQPVLGQMRLTWWHDALERLDHAPAPAEPLLRAIAAEILPLGISGVEVAALVDPWDDLIAPERDAIVAAQARRGAILFSTCARLISMEGSGIAAAGAAWAIASVASADEGLQRAAREVLAEAAMASWPARARPLLLPALALAGEGRGPRAAARLAAFLLLGIRPLPRGGGRR